MYAERRLRLNSILGRARASGPKFVPMGHSAFGTSSDLDNSSQPRARAIAAARSVCNRQLVRESLKLSMWIMRQRSKPPTKP